MYSFHFVLVESKENVADMETANKTVRKEVKNNQMKHIAQNKLKTLKDFIDREASGTTNFSNTDFNVQPEAISTTQHQAHHDILHLLIEFFQNAFLVL